MVWWSNHLEQNSIADGLYKEIDLSALVGHV